MTQEKTVKAPSGYLMLIMLFIFLVGLFVVKKFSRKNILTQTASCKYGLKVALNSIKSRGRRDYGARYYNSLLFN